MGSSLSRIADEMESERNAKEYENNRKYMEAVIDKLERIPISPNVSLLKEFHDFQWLWSNQEKIMKLRKLIDLIEL